MSYPTARPVTDYPGAIVTVNHVEPVPRRIRAMVGGRTVIDTTAARYVWEIPYYPQFYLPTADVDPTVAADENAAHQRGLDGYARVDWSTAESWYEEDEEIFIHPRSPYSRVDALRSSRHVQVFVDGVLLADSHAPVLLFETGLPTRYYLPRTDVRWQHLTASELQSQCPYKGVTSGYWSLGTADHVLAEGIAWAYDFPLPECQEIAGLVAFYNEKVDITLDGVELPRPRTTFS